MMLLTYVYDDRLAQASYLVACQRTGEAVVIDPARDITPYLAIARDEGLRVVAVLETHIHADYVSGAVELAHATGAAVYVSGHGDGGPLDYAPRHMAHRFYDGETLALGHVTLTALHTPGHTPEHLAFTLTDTASHDAPLGVFGGDFLFVGSVGRPDLLETALGQTDSARAAAAQMFRSVAAARAWPGYWQMWPGHGAGSACGADLGSMPSSTIGYEVLVNPAFQHTDEGAFVDWLLGGQPETPRYFGQMKRVNARGGALLNTLTPPTPITRAAVDAMVRNGVPVFDLRDRHAFARAHVPGTVNVGADNRGFVNNLGWLARYDAPFVFVAPDDGESLREVLTALRSIGLDDTPGYVPASAVPDGPTDTLDLLIAEDLPGALADGALVLDVRATSEWDDGHIAGARHIHYGQLQDALGDLPRDRRIVTVCASGYRSQIAASLLRAHGFADVAALNDQARRWADVVPVV